MFLLLDNYLRQYTRLQSCTDRRDLWIVARYLVIVNTLVADPNNARLLSPALSAHLALLKV